MKFPTEKAKEFARSAWKKENRKLTMFVGVVSFVVLVVLIGKVF